MIFCYDLTPEDGIFLVVGLNTKASITSWTFSDRGEAMLSNIKKVHMPMVTAQME